VQDHLRVRDAAGPSVGAVGHERVEGVGDRHDPARERDLLPHQPARIPAAVEVLMATIPTSCSHAAGARSPGSTPSGALIAAQYAAIRCRWACGSIKRATVPGTPRRFAQFTRVKLRAPSCEVPDG